MPTGAYRDDEELEDYWEEMLQDRPEVRTINMYAVIMAYIRVGLKGVGALTLLWATVVLLGGFVSDLKTEDFQVLTMIAAIQAAGLFDVIGDDRFAFWGQLLDSLGSWGNEHHEHTQLPMIQRLKTKMFILLMTIVQAVVLIVGLPVGAIAIGGPFICVAESVVRLAKQDYDIAAHDTSKANLKPALNIFYYVSVVHGILCLLYIFVELVADEMLVKIVSQRHGLSTEVLHGYFEATKQMCVNNPASTGSWNLITYGAGLLDSQSPGDYLFGGRVLTMLIDQYIPVPITWLLIRSPRQRIQRLIGTLAWRSPAEREMRWFAARIVEHLAGDLNLAHFPGALECISSLFDISCHNNVDQEALHLPFVIGRNNPRRRKGFLMEFFFGRLLNAIYNRKRFLKSHIIKNGGTLKQDEDLVLPGLRILENLAHDRHNCTLIYSSEDLLSRVVAPVSSNKLVEDIKINAAWAKVVDGSLKVVSRLMGSPGSTGEGMRSLIADDSIAVNNLEAVLNIDMKSSNSFIELKMQAIDVLTQLALHHPASTSHSGRREKLIERVLPIFLSTDWMGDYLKDEKMKIEKPTTSHVEKKMKEAKETASRLKEKAGEALAMLFSDSEVIKSFIGCDDDVHRLTELLDSNTKTIKCEMSATDTVEIDINIGCRVSAAIILKNLSHYAMERTLQKVLEELFPIQAEASSKTTTPRCWERVTRASRNDIENPSDDAQGEVSALGSNIQQCDERRLQAEMLSLVAAIRANNNLNLAAILNSQTPQLALDNFVVRLKKMMENNMYATPACLAIQKLTCEMVIQFIPHDLNAAVIDKHDIIGTLRKASKMMAGLESSMLFAGLDRDCHGLPLKPLSGVLTKTAEDLLRQRKQELGINTVPASVP